MNQLKKVQKSLKESNIDAWLVYQYIDMNPFFNKLIGTEDIVITRRAFLVIPQEEDPYFIHSKIDSGLKDLGYKSYEYISYNQFRDLCKNLFQDYETVAMDYSPESKIPNISKVDAGIVDFTKTLGLKVISSRDLLKHVNRISNEQIDSHLKASKKLDEIRKRTFRYIENSCKEDKKVTEYDIQEYILKEMEDENMETVYRPQCVINENASRGHYIPGPDNSKVLEKGDLLLIDMWHRFKEKGSIYADITWMLFRGNEIPTDIQEVWKTVIDTRDLAIKYMRGKIEKGKTIQGYEVDRIAREYVSKQGYGENFVNRLGHSIGTFVHGEQANLDNWENKDVREIYYPHITSVEPCIKIPGKFGVRSEVDVLLQEDQVKVTTEIQDTIYKIKC
jgi:Xaa-Pro aminopeptidase